jgi:L-aminopeptidase/D-esterase-like protein
VLSGLRVGHWTDREAWTGCTVLVLPEGNVCSGEVRGLSPGTRETDVLAPGASVEEAQAIVLSGGSAFGLAAAQGVMAELEAAGRGHPTPAGVVPIVPAAVVFDLPLGRADRRPGPEEGAAAYRAAAEGPVEEGSVGAGTGTSVGKLDGAKGWTKGGLGVAAMTVAGGVTVAALAVANAFGDVIGEDGEVLAGLRRDGRFVRSTEALAELPAEALAARREATTLVVVATDAALPKIGCYQLARAAHAGVARATDPAASSVDGDVAFAVALGTRPAHTSALLGPAAATVTAAAIRRAVRLAQSAPGCPALADLDLPA